MAEVPRSTPLLVALLGDLSRALPKTGTHAKAAAHVGAPAVSDARDRERSRTKRQNEVGESPEVACGPEAVSYTHLTLPTIPLV